MRKSLSLVSVLFLAFAWSGCSDDDSNCKDNDGDGVKAGSDCPDGDPQDCDDDDDSVWQELEGYADADGDGEAVATSTMVCTGETLPSGYLDTAGTDCDDTDADVSVEMTGYFDADGDGITAATAIAETLCTDGTLPAGYYDTAEDDCDDGDASAFEIVTGYPDNDHDTVNAATEMEACTDGTLPCGWSTTAGTDCDDDDVLSQSTASASTMCGLKGTCLDTESGINPALADMRGVGACVSIDCNGTGDGSGGTTPAPYAWDPTPTQASSPSACAEDSDCNTGDFCIDPAHDGTGNCWTPPAGCITDDEGLTCSEVVDCLTACSEANPFPECSPPTPQQSGAYALCVQAGCIEGATPKAQHLYNQAQICAAQAGCFAEDNMTGCALSACLAEFGACLDDAP